MTGIWLVRPMNTVAVDRPRREIRDVSMPNLIRILRERDSIYFAFSIRVENADLNFGGMSREQSKIGSLAVPRGSARIGRTFPDS